MVPKNLNCHRHLPESAPAATLLIMGIPDSELYKVLFDLSQVLDGHSGLGPLCEAVSRALRRIVSFDFLALALHDPVRDVLSLRAITRDRPNRDPHKVIRVNSDELGAAVFRDQEPVVLSPLEEETRWSDIIQEALEDGIQAIVLVPLTSGTRRLGVLGFGFNQPFEKDPRVLCFLRRVAAELAAAVESHLTRQALLRERDRMRVLFEVTNALISKLPMDELFPAISRQLESVVAFDFAVIVLVDRATGAIQMRGLHDPGGFLQDVQFNTTLPEGLPAGEALATGRPVVVSTVDFDRFPSPIYRTFAGLGFSANCSIPIFGPNGLTGVLDLARRSTQPFTEDEIELLVQVGRQVAIAMENAVAYRELTELKDKLATEKLYLEDEIRFDQNIGNMIGEGPAFQAVLSGIQVVAPTDATVLIEGETGTGKELVARAVHDLSGRSRKSFIKVNCAAIPATLLESELFGHEKGSFTGAFAQKIGRFELAHQGTLFLDEVGEIPLELQSKLLRAIQEQELERLGGTRTIRVDVRFIAATNRSLKQMVEEGKFRSDLYYRLHVFPLTVPPLRERREDIPLLVRYFTQKYATRMNRPIDSVPTGTIEALTNYEWPGNIRELQNVIERSVILSPGRTLTVSLPEIRSSLPPLPRAARPDDTAERDRILQALRECGGRVAGPKGAANLLGLRRTTLQSRMRKYGIERRFD